jgi:hypothetical protein
MRLSDHEGTFTGRLVIHDEVAPIDWAVLARRFAIRLNPFPFTHPGPPDLKRRVEARIAARKAARWERKLAGYVRGFPLYEG